MPEETKDAKTEEKPKTIAELLKAEEAAEADGAADFDPAILEKVDLSLPQEFQVDSLAAEMVDHISNYHKAVAGRKAARAQGDHQRAEQLAKLAAYSRLASAYIQAEWPGVKLVADEIARARVIQVRNQRRALLETEADEPAAKAR